MRISVFHLGELVMIPSFETEINHLYWNIEERS